MALIQVPLTDSLNDWRIKTNQISTGLGDFTLLPTAATNVVGAINEIKNLDFVFSGDKVFNDTVDINAALTADSLVIGIGDLVVGPTAISTDVPFTATSTLNVTGTTTLTALDATNTTLTTLNVGGGDLVANGTTLVSNVPTSVNSTLDITGVLDVDSNIISGGNLSVSGSASIVGAITGASLNIDSGDFVANGTNVTINVPTTINSSLSSSSLSVTNNATVGGTLGVTGTSTLGTLNAAGTTVSTLNAGGGDLVANGSTVVSSVPTTVNSTLNVTGTSTLGTLNAAGTTVSTLNAGAGDLVANGSSVAISVPTSISAETILDSLEVTNGVLIQGNLEVRGTYITADTLSSTSPILVLNSEQVGNPTDNAGLRVERGDLSDVLLVFNETIDQWTVSLDAGLTFKEIVIDGDKPLFDLVAGGLSREIRYDNTLRFNNGAGITASYDDSTGPDYGVTFTNTDKGSSQNIFKNFAVSGQSTIVADNNNDTLTITNNSGIQLLANAGTDTLTINHANTSDAASTNQANSGGAVVQSINVGLDEFGHVSTLTASSINLDNRYYTETESDARFVNSDGDTMTDTLLIVKANVLDNDLATRGNIELRSTGGTVASIGFHRLGNSAMALYHGGYNADALYIRQATGETYKVWHAGSDGSGSGLDADLLDGQDNTFYRNASNINAGTINDAYLPDTITSNITGNAATASRWLTARAITLAGDLTGSVSIDGSSNVTLSAQVINDSHEHDGRYYTEAESDARFVNVTGDTITGSLTVNQSVSVLQNLTVSGNLVVEGNTTTIDSTITTLSDPVITLAKDTTADDNKDRGVEFKWHDGSAIRTGFFGYDDSTGYFSFIRFATNNNEVFSGTLGDIQATNFKGNLIGNANTATSATTATRWATARTISLAGDLTGNVSIDGSANVTLSAQVVDNSHNHIFSNISDGVESVQDIVGAMVSGNTEAGISVVYQDIDGTLDFDVNDFTITVGGVVTGTGTVSNLGNVTITTSFGGQKIPAAVTAERLETSRTIALSGDVVGSVLFDGSTNVTIAATIQPNSVALGTDTTGNYVGTVAAGTGIVVAGADGEGITKTISHADTSAQASVNNSGNTFIQDITLDEFGHITGLVSATAVINNGAVTVNSGGGLTGSGTFSMNQSNNQTVTISHADTSAQASINNSGDNSGGTVIQDIFLDTYGHITSIGSVNLDGRYSADRPVSSVDAVGSYIFAYPANNTIYTAGTTIGGATLRYSSSSGVSQGTGPGGGTWRAHGYSRNSFVSGESSFPVSASVWHRIA